MQQGYIVLIDFQLYPPWASGLYNACAAYPAPGAPGIPFCFADLDAALAGLRKPVPAV
ncbi:hypothetical protein [Stutzerimonas nitrititolerans]|uniref:hypothetical protein n=1 Tax=Stutzerimonas nitrititolerans TaxID=2482751 RepID=UPI0028B0D249|nr:hypothetical protein [Stutzerimonas nitrititolerans]